MKNFKNVRIINCVERKMEGLALQRLYQRKAEDTEISIAYDSEMWGAWKTYKEAMSIDDNSPYLILSEDDVTFPIDILQRIDYILNFAPKGAWLFFFVPTNQNMVDAVNQGHHVLTSKYNFYPQVAAIPRESRLDFLEKEKLLFPEESDSGDGRFKRYFHEYNIPSMTILPSQVQHLGAWRSALGYNGKVGNYVRNSFCYEPDLDIYSIDWEHEFANPYKCKMTKGVIGWEDWKVGDPIKGYNSAGLKKKL